jgi:hypothetical protein
MEIEDYELLTMYSKVKGDAVAKALAKSVLDACWILQRRMRCGGRFFWNYPGKFNFELWILSFKLTLQGDTNVCW